MAMRQSSNVIVLDGDCGVEEAEALFQALSRSPGAIIDWSSCGHLHTAVVQLILATNVPVKGPCGDSWLERWASQIVQR